MEMGEIYQRVWGFLSDIASHSFWQQSTHGSPRAQGLIFYLVLVMNDVSNQKDRIHCREQQARAFVHPVVLSIAGLLGKFLTGTFVQVYFLRWRTDLQNDFIRRSLQKKKMVKLFKYVCWAMWSYGCNPRLSNWYQYNLMRCVRTRLTSCLFRLFYS